jgi:hypothetical protein
MHEYNPIFRCTIVVEDACRDLSATLGKIPAASRVKASTSTIIKGVVHMHAVVKTFDSTKERQKDTENKKRREW